MAKGRTFVVPVRIARWNVEGIEDLRLLNEILGHRKGKLFEKPRYDVPPCLLKVLQMERLDRKLGSLVGGEAGPFVASIASRPTRRQLKEAFPLRERQASRPYRVVAKGPALDARPEDALRLRRSRRHATKCYMCYNSA